MDKGTPKPLLRTLIIEDSEFDCVMLVSHLEREGFTVSWKRVETAGDMEEALECGAWDIVFSDHRMPEFSADAALRVLQRQGLDLPFIIVSGGIGEDKAADLMKAGAHDFVFKGQLGRLLPAVRRELREAGNRRARRAAEQSLRDSEKRYRLLWERSPDAILVIELSGRVAFANPAAEALFGRSSAELAQLNASRLLAYPGSSGNSRALLPWEGGQPAEHAICECTGRRKDGAELVMEVGFSEVALEGRTWHVAFIRDITQRRQAETALAAREREFAMARAIQQRLYPQQPPPLEGYELAGATFPADETGGDYFDYLPMADGDLGLVVGDVSGHGMGPALIMAETRAYLRVVAINRRDAGQVLTRANQALADDLEDSDRFVTSILVRLDGPARRLAYANAGHLGGILLDATGELKARLNRRGPPMGMFPGTEYREETGPALAAGDLLLLYTDGLEDAERADGERFGAEGVWRILRQHRHDSAPSIIAAMHQAVIHFQAGEPQTDDLTLLVLKVP